MVISSHPYEQTEGVNEDGTSNSHEGSEINRDEGSENMQSFSTSNYSSETDASLLNFKSLGEIYAATGPIELEEDELYLMGIDEPTYDSQATNGDEWRKAMQAEIKAVERKGLGN